MQISGQLSNNNNLDSMVQDRVPINSHLQKKPCINSIEVNDNLATISKIPIPILNNTFSYLSCDEQVKIATTCKRFNNANDESREKWNWANHKTSTLFKHYIKWFNLKHPDSKVKIINVLHQKIQFIKKLEIQNESALIYVLKNKPNVPNLTSLTLGYSPRLELEKIICPRKYLKKIDDNDNVFKLIADKCPRLQELTVLSHSEYDLESNEEGLIYLFNHCSNVTSFTFEICEKTSDDFLPNILSKATVPLNCLILGEHSVVSEGTFESILKLAPNLKEVIIEAGLDYDVLPYLIQYCNNLESVTLSKTISFLNLSNLTHKFSLNSLKSSVALLWFLPENNTLEYSQSWFPNCKNLKELDFIVDEAAIELDISSFENFFYNEAYICTMLSYMPNLEKLSLTLGIISIVDESEKHLKQDEILKAIGLYNKNLQSLNLSMIKRNYTNDGLIALAKGCPNLESITFIPRINLKPITQINGLKALFNFCPKLKHWNL